MIFTIPGTNISLHWYGVIMAAGIIIGGVVASWGVRKRGENSEHIWDLMVWAVPAGIVGARLWYVITETLGGSRYYLDQPLRILNVPEGGLHFYGAVLFGAVAGLLYVRKHGLDYRLILDAAAPALLIGQALIRPANFINQELYGQPTALPWGIPIDAANRLAPWNNLSLFPFEATRFHPTFAYEMLWNFLAVGLLLWVVFEYGKRVRPGSIFAGWLILEGIGRELIEFFRPDQPLISGTVISYSRIAAGLMIISGIIILLDKYGVIQLPRGDTTPKTYLISRKTKRA
jgi:phosphatidylglycerol:prolipoprotein diacylglycerol transferase